MRPFDRRLLTYAHASVGYLIGCVAAGVAGTVLILAQATLLAHAIGSAFGGATLDALSGTLWGLLGVFGARAILAWLQEVLAQRCAAAAKSQLRTGVVEHALRLGPRWIGAQRSGELVALVGPGLDALDGYFARYLPQLVLAVAVPVMVVARLFAADTIAAVTIAVTLPLVPVFMILVGLATQAEAQRRWRALAVLSHHFTDVVAGLPTLKVFGRAKAQAMQVRRVTAQHRVATMRTLRLAFLSALVLELLASLAVALVAVGVGLRLVNGGLDLETALLVLLLAPEAYLPLRAIGAQHHASAEGLEAAADAFAVLETPVRSGPAARESTAAAIGMLETPVRGASAIAATRGFRLLEIAGVEVRSTERVEPLLPATSLAVRAGEVIALTGPSGAGKSTLLDLLMGFAEPTAGCVRVDGTDLRDLDIDAWRAAVAWVPQHPHLPEPTVGANVALGLSAVGADAVRAALAQAGASQLEPARPTGDDGSLVSAGERRRIAIARALVRDAPLLLLDEPTAGLDEAAEAAVIDSLRAAGRTVVVVAHRPAVIAAADRVVVVGPTCPAAGHLPSEPVDGSATGAPVELVSA